MESKCFRVVGVDPGSRSFGLSVIDYDIETKKVYLRSSETFHADKLLNEESPELVLGDRGARHRKCSEFVLERCRYFRPQLVSCESAYMRFKFVTAFQSLVEGIVAVRLALWDYDPTLSLLLVDPPTAKKAVGAPGKGGDKEDVKRAIVKLIKSGILIVDDNLDFNELDEHSIDSIAITYWLLNKWLKETEGLFSE